MGLDIRTNTLKNQKAQIPLTPLFEELPHSSLLKANAPACLKMTARAKWAY